MSYDIGQHCKSCPTPVIWAVTATKRRMLVDAEPHPEGNIDLSPRGLNGQAAPFAYVVPVRDLPQYSGKSLRRSHFVTCPAAAAHRRKGGKS